MSVLGAVGARLASAAVMIMLMYAALMVGVPKMDMPALGIRMVSATWKEGE